MTWLHAVLGVVTLVLMYDAGSHHAIRYLRELGGGLPMYTDLAVRRLAIWGYMLPMIGVIAAHEMGHMAACWAHKVQTSWPYLLPGFPLVGTSGAFLRLRNAIPTRRALFDIGASGPIAGAIVALPCAWLGVMWSIAIPIKGTVLRYKMPLAMQWAADLYAGGGDLVVHPLAWAGFIGLLLTAINLIPFGQLDGGQMMTALWPKAAPFVSWTSLVIVAGVGWWFGSPTYFILTLLMLLMAVACGRAPYVPAEPLGRWRGVVAFGVLLLFLVTMSPIRAGG